jgi:predicted DCC family thiol-disulfide oxidoreductase YuxK
MNARTEQRTAVYFDGGCPLCSREIGFYQKRRGADAIDWIDVSTLPLEDDVAADLKVCDAMARFHVRLADGSLIKGGRAFIALWRALPLTKPLGWFMSIPPGPALLDAAYEAFLKVRRRAPIAAV